MGMAGVKLGEAEEAGTTEAPMMAGGYSPVKGERRTKLAHERHQSWSGGLAWSVGDWFSEIGRKTVWWRGPAQGRCSD